MTKVAFITDVHGDVQALLDALAQIERLGCERVLCGGDLVDWGRFPEETLALLREERVPCIRGNHDRWALREGRDASKWELTPAAVAFLESLPPTWAATIDGVRVAVWHARPGSDMRGVYPDAAPDELRAMLAEAGADVLLVGHTHLPFCIDVSGGGLVANPGALLRDPAHPMETGAMLFDRESGRFVASPAPGGGTFGVLELPARRFTVYRAVDGTEVAAGGSL